MDSHIISRLILLSYSRIWNNESLIGTSDFVFLERGGARSIQFAVTRKVGQSCKHGRETKLTGYPG